MASDRSVDNHTMKGRRREHKAINVSAALRTGAEIAMTIIALESLLINLVPCDSEGEDGEILETEW